MKIRKLIYLIILVAAYGLLITTCEDREKDTYDFSIAEDDALSTSLFDDVFTQVNEALMIADDQLYSTGSLKSDTIFCKTITVEQPDTSFWPRTITVDYGEGCEGPQGRIRKGKLIITLTGRYMQEGSSRTVTFEDFYMDGFRIEGTKTVINQGRNLSGQLYFSISLAGGKVSNDTMSISKEFTRTRTWIGGEVTPRFHADDEYLIQGTASGTNRQGITYTRTIVKPLYTAVVCRWIKAGKVLIESPGRKNITIDYGDGICDNRATVIVGNETREIELPRNRRDLSFILVPRNEESRESLALVSSLLYFV